MSVRLNCKEIVALGEEIVDRTEVWSVKQSSTDGEVSETTCPEGEVEARRLQSAFGGIVWVRTLYVTEGRAAEEVSDEELLDMQP
jgi:hypothetical protein